MTTVMDCFKILYLLSPEVTEENKESHLILYLGPVLDTDKVHLLSVRLLFHFCLTYHYFIVILLLTYWLDCMASVYYFCFYIYIYDFKKKFKRIMLESRDLAVMNVGLMV